MKLIRSKPPMTWLGRTFLACAMMLSVQGAVADDNTLRVVPQADLKILDPNFTTATITAIYGFHIYDTLFGVSDKLEVSPQMVDTYHISDDGLTYTFTLRPGLKFHDGNDVTTADVIASIKRWYLTSTGKRVKARVKDITATDESTFVITLSERYSLLLDSFARILGDPLFVMPEGVASIDPQKQITSKIGSGPFVFVEDEWVPGSKVVFKKFQDYVPRSEPASWTAGGKVVRVDKIEWNIIKDAATELAALAAGEIDVVEDPEVGLLDSYRDHPKVKIAPLDPLGRTGLLVMNHLHPPFNDPKAREAMLWLTNQEEHLQAIAGRPENYTVCPAFFICGSPLDSTVGIKALASYDIERAKQLVEESGYDGRKVVVMVSTTQAFLNAAGLITAQNMRKAGFNVEIQQLDWGTITSRRGLKDDPATSSKGWHVFHSATKVVNTLTPTLMSMVSGGGPEKAWYGWPTDPKIEEYRDLLADAVTPDEKKKAVDLLQGQMFKTNPYINYGYWSNPAAYSAGLKGLILSPIPVYWNVSK